MRFFRKVNITTLENSFIGKLHGKIKLQIEPAGLIATVSYGDYLFSTLKKDLNTITDILNSYKVKQATIKFLLNGDELVYRLNKDSTDTLVELYETVKSVLPSSKYISVESNKVEYGLNDLDLAITSGAKVSNVLSNFFAEDYTDMSIVIDLPGNIQVAYEFKWLNTEIIGQTFSNSGRYYEMINFVHDTPHPNVNTFIFKFKDSTKGIYAELDIDYVNEQSKAENLKENEWIRSKLNQKYTHLPVF